MRKWILLVLLCLMPLTAFGEGVTDLGAAKAGDYVVFGSYEQDHNTDNGKEPIEWLVLAREEDRLLVISRYALDSKQYNQGVNGVTWETCTLRAWLNRDFLNAAFSADEQAMIPTVTVPADKNPEYKTDPGNATQDKVFLLSFGEAGVYFADYSRACSPTAYAIARGAKTRYNGYGSCMWWLRSPGTMQVSAASVRFDGSIQHFNDYYAHKHGLAVRPAMWIVIPGDEIN